MAVKKVIFLRDDDVTAADEDFLRIFRFLLDSEVPAVYAVIPAKAQPGLSRLLTEHPKAGRLFETAQHGLHHTDHAGNRFLRQEFGPARAYELQLADIRAGRDLMKKRFGPLFVPVFVPPFHMYNSDTVKAAAKAGLKAFSASKTTGAFYGLDLAFLPALVNVNDYDLELNAIPLKLETLKVKTLSALRSSGRIAGVYFHHADLRGRDFEVFEQYVLFLKGLAARGWIEFSLFSGILKDHSGV